MSNTASSSTCFSLKIRTALSGSPTYCGLSKFTVLTRRPFSTSRLGMILDRSMAALHLREILQEALTPLVALLRMELHAEDVVAPHGAGERKHVVRTG